MSSILQRLYDRYVIAKDDFRGCDTEEGILAQRRINQRNYLKMQRVYDKVIRLDWGFD